MTTMMAVFIGKAIHINTNDQCHHGRVAPSLASCCLAHPHRLHLTGHLQAGRSLVLTGVRSNAGAAPRASVRASHRMSMSPSRRPVSQPCSPPSLFPTCRGSPAPAPQSAASSAKQPWSSRRSKARSQYFRPCLPYSRSSWPAQPTRPDKPFSSQATMVLGSV
jgi:hypothetical protein